MKDLLVILDAGHGGLDSEGKYVTPGKRMVKDDVTFYEGVNNRDNVKRIKEALQALDIECVEVAHEWRDTPLSNRVRQANELARGREAIYLSIHSDAAGNGKEWHTAKGFSAFIYNSTRSKKTKRLGQLMQQELVCNLGEMSKDRHMRQAGFKVLRSTAMPAVLIEGGFHTNESEVSLMVTDEWKDAFTKAVVDAVLIYISEL